MYENPVAFDDEAGAWTTWQGPAGVFHDSARTQLSIVSLSATAGAGWDMRRFRPNIVVGDGDERELLGAQIRVGTVCATVVKEIDRCVMVTRPQPGGIERDLDVMRSIVRTREGNLGVGALVTTPGRIERGDRVEVLAAPPSIGL
jgi:hypothetical protein